MQPIPRWFHGFPLQSSVFLVALIEKPGFLVRLGVRPWPSMCPPVPRTQGDDVQLGGRWLDGPVWALGAWEKDKPATMVFDGQ